MASLQLPVQRPEPPARGADPTELLQAVRSAVALLDASGCLVWQNSAFGELIGQPDGGLLGRHIAAVLGGGPHTPAAEQPLWIANRLATGSPIDDMPLHTVRPDGRPLHCRLSISPVAATGQLLVTLHDAAELLQLRRQAEDLKERLHTVQQLAGIGVWEHDAAAPAGRYDTQTVRLAGLDADSPVPSMAQLAQVIHPGDDVLGPFQRSLASPGDHAARFRVTREGAVRHLHAQWRVLPGPDGRPQRALGILRDCTDAAELVRSFEDANTHLSLALELGRIGMWRHDLATDRVECNEVLAQLAGLQVRAGSFAHRDWLAIVHPDDQARVAADVAAARCGREPTDLQARYRGRDGDWRTLMTRRVPQRDQHGRAVALLGVVFDVTAQAADAQRALDLARTLEAAARATGLGICALQRSGTSHRRWRVTWNAQMQALHGWPASRRPPVTLAEWLRHGVHADDALQVRGVLRRWLRRPSTPVDLEFRTPPAGDQPPRWLSLRGDAPDGQRLFAVVREVTERHQSLQRLQAAVERAELAARGVGIGTWERRADGSVLWDEQMFRLREMPPHFPGPSEEERLAVVHPDDREAMLSYHPPSQGGSMSPTYEFRVVLPDGRIRWLASRSTSLVDAQGREVRRIGVNWDITDNKNAELALRERELVLRESQAKSRLLARISHELRTPLHAILGMTQLMLMAEQPPDPAHHRHRLEQVQAASRHLLALIDGVLDLSAYEGGEMQVPPRPVDLPAVAAQAVALVESTAAAHGVRLQVRLHAEQPPNGDATRLRQVLVNLLSNAVKYNRRGGLVKVSSRTVAALHTPPGHAAHGHVVLSVADDGPGIPPDRLGQLFQPFNRLGREHDDIEGTGIGLAIVKALVCSMGGWMQVRSSPGRGSVFEVWLQQAEAEAAGPAGSAGPAPLATPAPPGLPPSAGGLRRPLPRLCEDGRGRVLYIEDNPINAMIVQASVAHRPLITLDVAVDGASGIRLAHSLRPHLVLLDMQLPDTDGHAVLQALRADPATAHLPCIALSANVLPEDITQALAAGFTDYWTKPIELPALLGALDALFGAPDAHSHSA